MDIFCASCGEPWDSYHLLYDEVDETELPAHVRKDFVNGGGLLDETTRPAFEALGWAFAGNNVLSIVKCPCCKPERILRDAVARRKEREAIASILEDDLDALMVTLAEA